MPNTTPIIPARLDMGLVSGKSMAVKKAYARRLGLIPPYLFSELDIVKARARGDVIDLCEGNPDAPAPGAVTRVFRAALARPENHRYPTYAGKLSARESVAAWYRRRFGVKIEPSAEAVMLIGSKEGIAHLIWGVAGPGDTVAVADPVFPMYMNQTRLAGARPISVPLLEENGFLPDLNFVEHIAPRIKLLCINFPNNPTAAVADRSFYGELVKIALKHGFYISNDNVYSELSFAAEPPPSILEAPGAKRCCVEFHSLSKTFSMAGWRVGFAVGNPVLLQSLLKIKQNTDSGPFGAIQDAAAYALDHAEELSAGVCRRYRRRRDAFCAELSRQGWPVPCPQATFYVWARTKGPDYPFVLEMLKKTKVVAAPGSGFGRFGRGYVRFALVQPELRVREAARRIGRWLCRREKNKA